jgi:hypothetical protein
LEERTKLGSAQEAPETLPYLATTWGCRNVGSSAQGRSRLELFANGPLLAGARIGLQAGDFLALNASASYSVSPTSRLEVGGYLLHQISASSAESMSVADRLQRVHAFDPVTQWRLGKATVLAAAY